MYIVYLYSKGTFKTQLRSDTLWGILCWAIRDIYGLDELEKTINSYINGTPEFILSSTFPFIENGNEKQHFLPKPLIPEIYKENKSLTRKDKIKISKDRKKIKKVQQLSLSDFETYIAKPEERENIIKKTAFDEKKYDITIKSESIPHNTIDRLSGGTLKRENESGQLFHVDEYYFDIKSENVNESTKYGLFFLVKGNIEKLEGALRFLNHVGYGGDRCIGKGYFMYKIEKFNITEPSDYNALTNLSLYYPKEDELTLYKKEENFNYEIEERQGYAGIIHHQKPSVSMFGEGSVFPKVEKDYFGQNVLVIPKSTTGSHNVFHYGFGFMVKIKI